MTSQQSTTCIKTKKCNACLQVFPVDKFYPFTDNRCKKQYYRPNCKPCEIKSINLYQRKHPEKFRESNNRYSNKYYHNNKQKRIIIYKRHYCSKLSPEKQEIYKLKVLKKYPELFNLVWTTPTVV